ncbi:hypothetical protein L0337_29690 [candidate division KSB1 bacterium]|nr:hypothetical protein [candidate division KSB1 bacterium]
MKKLFTTLLLMGMAVSPVTPQPSTPRLEPFGLEGKRVTALGISPQLAPSHQHLYATTEEDGVYRRPLLHPDSTWTSLGLEGKRIKALDIQVWGAGPAIFHTPVVGGWPDYSNGDSTLIYRFENNNWIPADSGIARTFSVISLASFASGGHEPPGFAFASLGNTNFYFVYRSHIRGRRWEAVFGSDVLDGPLITALAVNQNGLLKEVWIGGYDGLFFQPWLRKSVDMGLTWQPLFFIGLNLGPENGCHAFAFHPIDPGIVYVGMDGTVIKTIDGGKTWTHTGLRDTLLVSFPGLVMDPFKLEHIYAGGRLRLGDSWVLWESFDAGMTWQKVVPMFSLAGITRIVADPNTPGVIYIATAGNGVWRYESDIVAVKDRREEASPQDFALEQNYPNPFSTEGRSHAAGNGGTIIRFAIPLSLANSPAHLAIYNLRGELVRELLNRRLPADRYLVRWDGRNDAGREVASGIYLYRLQVGHLTEMRKLSLLK